MEIPLLAQLRFLPVLWEGAIVTMQLAAAASIASLVLALPVTLLDMSKNRVISGIARLSIELPRNVPLLIIVYLAYFGLAMAGSDLSALWCGVIALTLQNTAYIAEIYRGSLQSIDPKQWEGGCALGMTRRQTFSMVILPQALYRATPALFNQFVLLLKDTSVISAIAVGELLMQSKIISEKTASTFEIFLLVGLLYLLLTTLVGLAGKLFERYLAFSH